MAGCQRVVSCGLSLLLASTLARAELSALPSVTSTNGEQLAAWDLESLLRVQVFSVTKHLQPWFESPAAVFVITEEDIRRSGLTSIPELLRLAPGLNVARANVHAWAVSARGFNGLFADKLLVLIDGRSVYTPMFSGVWWNAQDTLLEDIERIEVVRGVDGTLWGANAVNGVINIISKSAQHTQGLLVSAGGGDEERGFGAVRYGGQVDEQTWYRVFAKGYNRAETFAVAGCQDVDRSQQARVGARLDRELANDLWTVQSEGFAAADGGIGVFPDLSQPTYYLVDTATELRTEGAHLLTRWTHFLADGGECMGQIYYDFEHRRHAFSLQERRHTVDLDLQHRFLVGDRHNVTWGTGFRASRDKFMPALALRFDPAERTLHLGNVFLQDEWLILPERLRFTAGGKLEYQRYAELAWQPSLRLAWTPTGRQTWWAALARAVRTPSRTDRDMRLNSQVLSPAMLAQVRGTTDFDSETVVGFETGYRIQPVDPVMLDLALFHNIYDELRGLQTGTPLLEEAVSILPLYQLNLFQGETYGAELSLEWRPVSRLRLQSSYSLLRMHLTTDTPGATSYTQEGDSPRHQLMIRAAVDLPGRWELDAAVRYVDSLPALQVPSYWAATIRVAWRPSSSWEMAVVGQHWLEREHQEFGPNYMVAPIEVQRNVHAKVTWRF